MEQTKALNALEPFLALSKSASSPVAASDLVTRATSHPSTFIFHELLSTPQIQALSEASPPYNNHLTLLRIFSYGTYADYHSNPSLPSLNDAQTLKLRQLSFLSLARDQSALTYSNLQHALGLTSARELEDLVISAIYAGLIQGALDPYHHIVRISSVSPLRDLPPNSIPAMLSTLDEWSSRCVSTLSELERQIAGIKAAAFQRHRAEEEWAAEVERLVEGDTGKELQGGKAGGEMGESVGNGGSFGDYGRRLGGGGGGAGKRGLMGESGEDEDDMDVDVEEEDHLVGGAGERRGGGVVKPAKKRGFNFGRAK